jgi:glutathione S-transferase
MKLYGRLSSINVQKVVWCLGELGLRETLDYERVDAGLEFGVTQTPAYLKLNPNGLVPTWVDGNFVLWESHAIVRYLAGVYAPGSLLPSDARVRADSERWMDWKLGTLWPALRVAFVGLVRTPAERRDIAAIAAAFGESSRLLAMLDATLADGRPYCAGESFTVGDIALGVAAHRWVQLGDRFAEIVGTPPELPALRAWHRRVTDRPAFAALGG